MDSSSWLVDISIIPMYLPGSERTPTTVLAVAPQLTAVRANMYEQRGHS